MRKFINLLKKPILIISSALFALFTVILVVVSCLPHGNKYTYSMGDIFSVEYIFDDDDELILEIQQLGQFESYEYDYRIKKGILYIKEITETEYEKIGKINAFELKMDGEGEMASSLNITMKCCLTRTIRTISIVMMILSGLATIGCVVVLILDKKGVINIQEKTIQEKNEKIKDSELIIENKTEIDEKFSQETTEVAINEKSADEEN